MIAISMMYAPSLLRTRVIALVNPEQAKMLRPSMSASIHGPSSLALLLMLKGARSIATVRLFDLAVLMIIS